jgi:hypothetical protein
LRGAPPGLPFRWEVDTIARGLNFTLTTDLGAIDAHGEIVGGVAPIRSAALADRYATPMPATTPTA